MPTQAAPPQPHRPPRSCRWPGCTRQANEDGGFAGLCRRDVQRVKRALPDRRPGDLSDVEVADIAATWVDGRPKAAPLPPVVRPTIEPAMGDGASPSSLGACVDACWAHLRTRVPGGTRLENAVGELVRREQQARETAQQALDRASRYERERDAALLDLAETQARWTARERELLGQVETMRAERDQALRGADAAELPAGEAARYAAIGWTSAVETLGELLLDSDDLRAAIAHILAKRARAPRLAALLNDAALQRSGALALAESLLPAPSR